MREAFAEKLTFEAPDLNVGPKEAQKILIEATQNLDPSQLCLVGSSLGGFYATWLAERISCRAVLLNPATEPWCAINDYSGVHTIPNTDRPMEVLPGFHQQARQMN